MANYEAVWLRKLFGELFERVLDTTVIYFDNKSGICLAKNLLFHDKSKHIEIWYHYNRDMVHKGAIRIHHISTDEQIVDILTKALLKGKFLVFREQLGLMDVTPPDKRHHWSRTLNRLFPPFWAPRVRNWDVGHLEGPLDNRVVDVSPLSVAHRVGDIAPLSRSLQSIPQLASYLQAGLIRIITPRLANGLREYLEVCNPSWLWCRCSTTWFLRSLLGRSVGNRMGWDVLPITPIARYGIEDVLLPHEILGWDVLPDVVSGWHVLPDIVLDWDVLSDVI